MHSYVSPKKRLLIVFVIVHSFATAFYQYGEPFYAARRLGWSAAQIALMEVMRGFVIALGAWSGGQLADRLTMRASAAIGLFGGAIGLAIGLAGFGNAGSLLVAVAIFNGLGSMVWPSSEAALMVGETSESVQHLVAIYNLAWSFGSATAVLAVTPILKLLGDHSFFILPLGWYVVAFFAVRLVVQQGSGATDEGEERRDEGAVSDGWESEGSRLTGAQRSAFRWLGWLANPLAYFAINVVNTTNPTIVRQLGIPFSLASMACSVWFYIRAFSFELLRRWNWWHYKWRFLCLTFAAGMVAFTCMELAPNVAVFLAAQVLFGLCTGLIYQSSLFYSMAESDTQGAHGGLHEAFIGVGTMFGPLIFFLGSRLAPGSMALPIAAVLIMMLLGQAVLYSIGRRTETSGA
jgi:MFS family permease